MTERCTVCGSPISKEGGRCSNSLCSVARKTQDLQAEIKAEVKPEVAERKTDIPVVKPDQEKTSAAVPNPEDLRFPKYRVVRKIGQGGMGVVWEAVQIDLKRKVAIKELPSHLAANRALKSRFEREAIAMARLSHPNIVNIFDRGTTGDTLYFVMEFVEPLPGNPPDLRELIKRGTLVTEQIRILTIQIARALDYAHEQKIIHRDIKPSNIMLDRKGHAKVADFGIAQVVDPRATMQNLTFTGASMGTWGYMAPEQRKDASSCDARSDVYSLGVMLYEMLTSELPTGGALPPSEMAPGLPTEWDAVVMKAMHPRPDKRFQTMGEFADALETLRPGQSVQVPMPIPSGPDATRPTGGEQATTITANCPKCGAPDNGRSRFCTRCRFQLLIGCPGCKANVRSDSPFCPDCGYAIEAHNKQQKHAEDGRRLLNEARDETKSGVDRAEKALDAAREFETALTLAPSDTIITENQAARALALRLFEEAGEDAIYERRFGAAVQRFQRILQLDAEHGKAKRRIEEIHAKKTDKINKANTDFKAGRTAEAVDALQKLAEMFEGDDDIRRELERMRGVHSRITTVSSKKLDNLRQERKYEEIAKECAAIREAGAVPPWLESEEAAAREKLEAAGRIVETAREELTARNDLGAIATAERALAIVSDYSEATEIIRRAREYLQRAAQMTNDLHQAVKDQRWFGALSLLKEKSQDGLDESLRNALDQASQGAEKARAGLRLITFSLLGVVAIGFAWMIAGAFATVVLGEPVAFRPAWTGHFHGYGLLMGLTTAVFSIGLLVMATSLVSRKLPSAMAFRWLGYTMLAVPPLLLAWWAAGPGSIRMYPNSYAVQFFVMTGAFLAVIFAAAAAGAMLARPIVEQVLLAAGMSSRRTPLSDGSVWRTALTFAILAAVAFLARNWLDRVPAALAVGAVLGIFGIGPRWRYLPLMAAAVLSSFVDSSPAQSVLGVIVIAIGAVLTSFPYRLQQSLLAAVVAVATLLLLELMPRESALRWLVVAWLMACASLARRLGSDVDLRLHWKDRMGYRRVSGPSIETPPELMAVARPAAVTVPTLALAASVPAMALAVCIAAVFAGWINPVMAVIVVVIAGLASAVPVLLAYAKVMSLQFCNAAAGCVAAMAFIITLAGIVLNRGGYDQIPDEWDRLTLENGSEIFVPLKSVKLESKPAEIKQFIGRTNDVAEVFVQQGPANNVTLDELEKATRDEITKSGGKILNEQSLRRNRLNGFEFEIQASTGRVWYQIYKVGDTLVRIRATQSAEKMTDNTKLLLHSFRPSKPPE